MIQEEATILDATSSSEVPPDRDTADQMLLALWSDRILRLIELLLGMAVIFSLLARWHPLFDLATHATWHCFWLALGVMFVTILRLILTNEGCRWSRRNIFRIAISSIAFVYFGLQLNEPWTHVGRADVSHSPTQPLKVLSWNVLLINTQAGELIDLVEQQNADVVILLEVNRPMGTLLEPLRERFAADYWNPEWSSGGTVIFSRIPGTRFREIPLTAVGNLAIEITCPGDSDRQPIDILAVHTFSPVTFNRARWRDLQLKAIGEWFETKKGKSFAIGDFNTTGWSPAFQDLIRSKQLIDSRRSRGRMPSWPSFFGPFGIPIDHALVNRQTEVVDRQVLSQAPGSDHRPITITVR